MDLDVERRDANSKKLGDTQIYWIGLVQLRY